MWKTGQAYGTCGQNAFCSVHRWSGRLSTNPQTWFLSLLRKNCGQDHDVLYALQVGLVMTRGALDGKNMHALLAVLYNNATSHLVKNEIAVVLEDLRVKTGCDSFDWTRKIAV